MNVYVQLPVKVDFWKLPVPQSIVSAVLEFPLSTSPLNSASLILSKSELFKFGLVSVLFVKVSVVALPTIVSVIVGKVNVPVFEIVLIIGDVNVLLVKVELLVAVIPPPPITIFSIVAFLVAATLRSTKANTSVEATEVSLVRPVIVMFAIFLFLLFYL